MAKLSKEIAKFVGRSRRAAAAAFLAYLGLGALPLAKQAPPPLDEYLCWLAAGVAAVGMLASAFVALKAVFRPKH